MNGSWFKAQAGQEVGAGPGPVAGRGGARGGGWGRAPAPGLGPGPGPRVLLLALSHITLTGYEVVFSMPIPSRLPFSVVVTRFWFDQLPAIIYKAPFDSTCVCACPRTHFGPKLKGVGGRNPSDTSPKKMQLM